MLADNVCKPSDSQNVYLREYIRYQQGTRLPSCLLFGHLLFRQQIFAIVSNSLNFILSFSTIKMIEGNQ